MVVRDLKFDKVYYAEEPLLGEDVRIACGYDSFYSKRQKARFFTVQQHPYEAKGIGQVVFEAYANDGYQISHMTLYHRTLDAKVKVREATSAEATQFLAAQRFAKLSRGNVRQTGWDPEFFFRKGDGSIFPAFEFLPPKHKAYKANSKDFDSSPQSLYTHVYYDGFQAEMATDADFCHGWGFDHLHAGLKRMLKEARKLDPKATITLDNVVRIPEPVLFTAKDEHVELGCVGSLNAYGTDPFRAEDPRQVTTRVAGGHVHFSFNGPKFWKLEQVGPELVKLLDLFIGVPTVAMFEAIDDPQRRRYYGRAGEYRLPKHGLEYRTLSNAWLGNPVVGNLIMDTARIVIDMLDFKAHELASVSPEAVRDIIDGYDYSGARKLIDRNKDLYTKVYGANYPGYNNEIGPFFHKLVNETVEAEFPKYRNVEHNWRLGPKQVWAAHCNGQDVKHHVICKQHKDV